MTHEEQKRFDDLESRVKALEEMLSPNFTITPLDATQVRFLPYPEDWTVNITNHGPLKVIE